MIFSRRAIQRLLDEVGISIGPEISKSLALRLNHVGPDSFAAMWELAVFGALSKIGSVQVEGALSSGRRPDIQFSKKNGLSFTADVTVVSDDGIEEQNPVRAFSHLLEKMKTRLGLPIGGLHLHVAEQSQMSKRGKKRVLRLPAKAKLADYIRQQIEPEIKRQIQNGISPLAMNVDDEFACFTLQIVDGPYSTMGYGAYNYPTIIDKNPLFNALKSKASQLNGAQGISGVIVADGNCSALSIFESRQNQITAPDIATDFLRQNSSIDFVFLISVKQHQGLALLDQKPELRFISQLITSPKLVSTTELVETFNNLTKLMPQPVKTPVNAYHSARANGFGLGHHGGHSMSNSKIKIGARELLEVLAGQMTVAKLNEFHNWKSASSNSPDHRMPNPFETMLSQGRLPISMVVEATKEVKADNWVEIEFGGRDPAISKFRY